MLGDVVDGRDDHRCRGFWMPLLSESVSKSACVFPKMSNSAFVRSSSASAALRHSVMWEEYRCSRRKIASRSPWSAASKQRFGATPYRQTAPTFPATGLDARNPPRVSRAFK